MLKSSLLFFIFLILSSTECLYAIDDLRFDLGGGIRLGGYRLNPQAKDSLETNPGYEEDKIENSFAKVATFDVFKDHFGIGYQWMTFTLTGSNGEVEQTLDLEFSMPVLSVAFFAGYFLHPKAYSRFGFRYGQGHFDYNLKSKTHRSKAEVTRNDSFHTSGTAVMRQIFFDSVRKQDGWGYRIGYYRMDAYNNNKTYRGLKVKASSELNMFLTLLFHI